MQAAVLVSITSEADLQKLFEERYQDLTGRCIKTQFGDAWADFFSSLACHFLPNRRPFSQRQKFKRLSANLSRLARNRHQLSRIIPEQTILFGNTLG